MHRTSQPPTWGKKQPEVLVGLAGWHLQGSTAGGPRRATLGTILIGHWLTGKGHEGCHPSDLGTTAASFCPGINDTWRGSSRLRGPRVARYPGSPRSAVPDGALGAPPDRCPRPHYRGLVGLTPFRGRVSYGRPTAGGKCPRCTSRHAASPFAWPDPLVRTRPFHRGLAV